MKKMISLLLALLLAFACAAPAFSAEAEPAFKPVLRFIASSDTHVRDDSNTNTDRIGKMLSLGYEAAAADSSHSALDAILIAGDLTNDGTRSEFDKFWAAVSGSLQGDTRFIGVVAKNHDGYEMKRKEMREYYSAVTGNDADFNVVINGYHFIGLSASESDAQHYDAKQLAWLREQLDAATAEDPNKPVFVTHHEHVRSTVYGSSLYDGWGVPYFTQLLNDYPQVVDFSGHSHFPLNDPRSIWQGNFTAIGTGAIYYSEFTIGAIRSYHPKDSGDTATCWIVEVDAANRIRLRGMDVEAGKQLCEYMLDNPANKENRPYTPAARKAASQAPIFAADAQLQVTPVYGGCEITAPVAQSTDGMPVVLYRAYAVNRLGLKSGKTWVLPCYYRAVEQTEIPITLDGLATGDYTINVVAENAYGGQSAPIRAKVTIDGENAFMHFLTSFGRIYQDLKDFFYYLFY